MTFTGLIVVGMVGSLAEAQVCINPDGEKSTTVLLLYPYVSKQARFLSDTACAVLHTRSSGVARR